MKLLIVTILTVTNILAADKKIIRNSDRFELFYQMTLPELNAAAKLWIPLARTDTHQKLEILSAYIVGDGNQLTQLK